jgi:nucleotide-binding universal stress UspA family protein
VLIVPRRAVPVEAAADVTFKHILCPVDFSLNSLDGVASALGLALEADARLTLLHVVEMPPITGTAEDLRIGELAAAAGKTAAERLEALIPDDARTYCNVETSVVEGRAHREILRQADERASDLIVMGVRGRGAVDLLVFGSTTHSVIRAARCPVLIVR